MKLNQNKAFEENDNIKHTNIHIIGIQGEERKINSPLKKQ